jgi:hypothetical protein
MMSQALSLGTYSGPITQDQLNREVALIHYFLQAHE